MLNPAHGCPVYAVLCSLLILQLFLQRTLAQGSVKPCTDVAICSPLPGAVWTQSELASVIWNPKMTYPFDQYEKVDVYIVEQSNNTRAYLLQEEVDLSIGMMAARLEATYFPTDLPVNRSCLIMMVGAGNDIDGTHQTLNSSSFYMIRTMQMISSSLVPIVPTVTPTITTAITAPTSILDTSAPGGAGGLPTNLPASEGKTSALSPLVIGLISAGIVTLLIAIVALTLLLRSQKRSKDFKSLHDQPSSPTDDTSKRSILKAEEGYELTGDGSGFGPTTTGPATGRSSSTTARSAEPMIKSAPPILGYHSSSPSPSSPVSPMPLLERKPSLTQRALQEPKPAEGFGTSGDVEAGAGAGAGAGAAAGSQQPSALTAGDAQLIADTFRKSMRTPRWEDDVEEEEPEQDDARRAANQLLRQELSQQGLDVRRGVQRRVTIQDRINRQSVPTPISETVSIPVPVPVPDP